MAANDPAAHDSLTIPVPQHYTTSSSGLTLRPPSPALPSSSSHSGQQSSHLSLHSSAPSSSSSLGGDPAQRQVIQAAWIDVEGEIPVSWL
jgi:hypothetical protein